MKKQGYAVISHHPVCIDFTDGRSVNYPRGSRFVAHPMNPSVKRALRRNDLRVVGPGEPPVKEVKLGLPPGMESRLKFNREKRLQDKIRAQKALDEAKAKAHGREVVARSSLKPAQPKSDTEN
jgi:hypothetical protein